MKRKITALLLACCMLAALAACSGNREKAPAPSDGLHSSIKDDKAPVGPIKKPPKDPSGSADISGSRGEESEEAEENGNPGAPSDSADLAAFARDIQDRYGISGFLQRQDPDDEAGAAMLDSYFPGLRDIGLAQMEVYLCMISFNSGEFSVVEAEDKTGAEAAAAVFQARIDSMAEEGRDYPATVELWQDKARVVTNGNYVLLVCAEDCDAIAEDFDALF